MSIVEEWRLVAAFPVYEVSNLGRVRRSIPHVYRYAGPRKVGECLKSHKTCRFGHQSVALSYQGKTYHRLVHRLVAEAFLPPPPPGMNMVLHTDDNPLNNRADNLRWGNGYENARDAVTRGRHAVGENAGGAKLDPTLVRRIRQMAAEGHPQSRIASAFGITQSNVCLIVNKVTWAHVA